MANIGKNTAGVPQPATIVGIDLGTTNSLVAIMHPGLRQPVVLREYNRSALLPSVVHFSGNGEVMVGDGARELLLTHPLQTVYGVKRLMGKSYEDVKGSGGFLAYHIIEDNPDGPVKVQVNDRAYTPAALSAYILKALKRRAEHILQAPVREAVISVPAYFSDAQRQATRDAGRLAGLDVLRIVNEPTAASLAYGLGLQGEHERTVAVYDLGGGTFDISILKIRNGTHEVLATNGDTRLGGDDLDEAVMRHWCELHEIEEEALGSNPGLAQSLRLKAEEAKRVLTTNDYYAGRLDNYELQLTREQFEELAQPLVDKTMLCCTNALSDAGISAKEVDAVIMAGGATRIPLVKKTVATFFGRPVNDSLDPDAVVALGAAIQAGILAGNTPGLQLQEVTPLSLGIETMGGLMDVLIPRNSRIPGSAVRDYTTQRNGQDGMKIAVYQGERDLVKDNRRLAEFDLTGIPPLPAGIAKVQVSFMLDEDGILKVKAREMRSGAEQGITVKPLYGLSAGDVEEMLEESVNHAGEDIQQRGLLEAQTQAQQLLDVTAAFLDRNSDMLSENEAQQTREAMDALQGAIVSNDRDVIQQGIDTLNEVTRPFAERLADRAVQQAMKGNT